jgi:hypothetical protein
VLALEQIYTWHPASEQPGVSLLRARQWLGPTLLTVLDQPATGVVTPTTSLQWSDWARQGAIIEAFAFPAGEQQEVPVATTATPQPGQTPVLRRELHKIGIEQTAVYPDGRHETLEPVTVIATMVLTPGGWLLDDYRQV